MFRHDPIPLPLRAQPVSGTIGITGFGGTGISQDPNNGGNIGLVNLVNSVNGTTYDRDHLLYTAGDIATILATDPNASINLIGYSRGAVGVCQLAGMLGVHGITVDNLITIDHISGPDRFNVSSNVTDALNIHQRNWAPQGGYIIGPNTTDIDYTGDRSVGHIGIVTIAAPIIRDWLAPGG